MWLYSRVDCFEMLGPALAKRCRVGAMDEKRRSKKKPQDRGQRRFIASAPQSVNTNFAANRSRFLETKTRRGLSEILA
jgi:hypothetical protein